MTPDGRHDPYPLYAAAHELGPVSPMEGGLLLVPGYDAANQVLRNTSFVVADMEKRKEWDPSYYEHSALESMSRSILESNAPDHGRMRSLIQSVFTPRRVAALEPAISASVDRLLDELADEGSGGSAVDFMNGFAFLLPVKVICELLGVPEADRHQFRALGAELTATLEFSNTLPDLTAADAAAEELHAYFAALAAERRADPKDDLVSALVQARDAEDGTLSDEELLSNLTLLLVAGFETTTNLFGNGLALLFEHPDIADGLRGGDVPTAGFIDEVLRFDSPVQATSRLAWGEHLMVGDIEAPGGAVVVLLLGAANRDPSRYADPDRFDPFRKDSNPLSFGAGAHFCLGSVLARLEASVVFPRLLSRFPKLVRRLKRTRFAATGSS
jgi:cytochrome P450